MLRGDGALWSGLQPGLWVFGASSDLAFQVTGVVVPGPGALALLAIAGFARRRRR